MIPLLTRLWRNILRALGVGEAIEREPDLETNQWGCYPWIALGCGLSVLLGALANIASRQDHPLSEALSFLSVCGILAPSAARLIWPGISRWERVGLLVTMTAALFALREIHAPLVFVEHDEFLHWVTVNDILTTGSLFHPNPMLPISPVYPALEIITAAIVKMTGLSVFSAGHLLIFVSRIVFVLGLFLLFERATGSARMASIAAVVYMSTPTFVFFDTMYSYGSIAITLMIVALFVETVRTGEGPFSSQGAILIQLPILMALAMTHHLMALMTALLSAVLIVVELLRTRRFPHLKVFAGAALGMATVAGWSAIIGNPGENYLVPVFASALGDLMRLVTFQDMRVPFVGEDGSVTPAWQRMVTLGSVFTLCVGLVAGFLRTLTLAELPLKRMLEHFDFRAISWKHSLLVLCALLACGYPVTIILRLTKGGWELGNRIGPFVYLGVSVVVAIGICALVTSRRKHPAYACAFGAFAAMATVAGIISGSGGILPAPSHYQVVADAASVEWMGIDAAKWTREWLGPGNRFFADRINRLLVATYGGQQVVTSLYDQFDMTSVVLAPKLGADQLSMLKATDTAYLMLDLRLTTDLPKTGFYFETSSEQHQPPSPEVIFKFNHIKGVSRVFDNGYNSIIDISRMQGVAHGH